MLKVCQLLFKVKGEGSDLHFIVWHKGVSECGFHRIGVGSNRTITLKNVVIGEDYEVFVSSVECVLTPVCMSVQVSVNLNNFICVCAYPLAT